MITARARLAVLIAFVFCPLFARAIPANPAVLTINVVDPSGAGVPGADVTIYAGGDRPVLSTKTDPQGRASAENLNPGEYVVEVQSAGFASADPQRLKLDTGETRQLTVTLKL